MPDEGRVITDKKLADIRKALKDCPHNNILSLGFSYQRDCGGWIGSDHVKLCDLVATIDWRDEQLAQKKREYEVLHNVSLKAAKEAGQTRTLLIGLGYHISRVLEAATEATK